MNRFSRIATALALVASLLASSLGVLAQTAAPQESAKTKTEAKQDPKKDQKAAKPVATNKTLSPSEDPNMIGKRNINKGSSPV